VTIAMSTAKTNMTNGNRFMPAKVVQAEDRTKRIYSFFMLRRSLPSPQGKVVQAERKNKINFDFPEAPPTFAARQRSASREEKQNIFSI
jgi:hypothetical protein